jgi:hypothetical protein
MRGYDKEVFENLILLVRNNDKESEAWLIDNGYQELKEFWDACEGVEISFKWLLENGYRQLAATVDALDGNDKAKVFLLSSGNRELAAFVEATSGSQKAISWLLKYNHHGWVMVAKEFFDIDKKKEKNFIWNLLNFGNPFR